MRLLFKLFQSLSRKERVIFSFALAVFLIASSVWIVEYINANTEIAAVKGGEYAEGMVGQPVFINPILAATPVDRALTELVFSDLGDFAENYRSEEKGKVWRYRLKEGIFWHDGEKITSDDIVFTIETAQNSDVYSPLTQNWQGISVNRISEREVEFKLPAAYVFFENMLTNLKPIPKHIFGAVPAANIKLSDYNLQPIGSGPYKFSAFKNQPDGYINFYELERNDDYFGARPYLDKIRAVFYQNEKEVLNAFNSGSIDGFELNDFEKIPQISFPHKFYSLKTLKYYAVFLNSYSHPALKDKNVRLALDLATNKNKLIGEVFSGEAEAANGPVLNGAYGLDFNDLAPEFSLEKAERVLNETGWLIKDGIREKNFDKETVKLEFEMTVPEIPFLIKTAESIKNDWSLIGVKLNVSAIPLSRINNEIIKPRDYQMIIFGNILGENPDLFSFWHSSQRFYPGLNLSLYENSAADRLIESIRGDLEKKNYLKNFESLQHLIVGDAPVIFLFSPHYLYAAKKKLNGFGGNFISFPEDRFKNIDKWYIKTARVFK